jgi:hypothetical protein
VKRRSPLKRGKPLKRSELKRGSKPIARRSETNSRPQEDKALFAEYKERNPLCELLPLLNAFNGPEWKQFEKNLGRIVPEPIQGHHIVHIGNRPDVRSNLIALCTPAHGFCHKHPVEGRIACWYVKEEKGELDVFEISKACGVNVLGWLETRQPRIAWFKGLADELIQRICQNEGKA